MMTMTASASVMMTMTMTNKQPPPASLTNTDNDEQGTRVPGVFLLLGRYFFFSLCFIFFLLTIFRGKTLTRVYDNLKFGWSSLADHNMSFCNFNTNLIACFFPVL
jgi:hypothetical protein